MLCGVVCGVWLDRLVVAVENVELWGYVSCE